MTMHDIQSTAHDEARKFTVAEFTEWLEHIGQSISLSKLEKDRGRILMNKRQFGGKIPPPDGGRLIGRAFGRDFYVVMPVQNIH